MEGLVAATMPDVDLLLYTFVRKEAVLSFQIEGMQSTLDELLTHEIEAVPGAQKQPGRHAIAS